MRIVPTASSGLIGDDAIIATRFHSNWFIFIWGFQWLLDPGFPTVVMHKIKWLPIQPIS